MRFLWGLVLGFTLIAPAIGNAATPAADPPSPAATYDVDQCLKTQKTAKAEANVCIGKVSEACMALPGGETTYGMIDCLKREIAVWDSKLNATYKALLKDSAPKMQTALKTAQRAWIKDRDATCALPYAYFEGGTIAGPLGSDCMNEMTARRFLLLDTYLHYAE
ncbi:MAG: lysozyme inhibitor LprI family protein [Caulobacterales bacterium]